jgi:hypothetical protein
MQLMLIAIPVIGFRHVVRMPAELRANWIFSVTCSGDERPVLSGAKCAAEMMLVLPTVLILFPWYVRVLGWPAASIHLAFGWLVGLALIECLLFGYRKLPFACRPMPVGDWKLLAPAYALTVPVGVAGLTWVERAALATDRGAIALLLGAGATVVTLRLIHGWQRRSPGPIDLDELPAPPTQRFQLSD